MQNMLTCGIIVQLIISLATDGKLVSMLYVPQARGDTTVLLSGLIVLPRLSGWFVISNDASIRAASRFRCRPIESG